MLPLKANIRIGIMSSDLALCNKPNSGQIAPWCHRCLYVIPVTHSENPGDQDCCSSVEAVHRERTLDFDGNGGRMLARCSDADSEPILIARVQR